MDIQLVWRIFLDTKKKHKAERLANRIFEVVKDNCTLPQYEIYWKNPNWYELAFEQSIQAENTNTMIMQILNRLSLLSYHWNLDLHPDFKEEDVGDLSGGTNTGIRIPGVVSMSFQAITDVEDIVEF